MTGEGEGAEAPRQWDWVRKRWPWLAGAAGALALGGTAVVLSQGQGEAPAEAAESSAQLVTAMQVQPRAFTAKAAVSGEIRPVRDIRVFAPAAGLRIEDVLIDEGDYVKEGQPLARLETSVAEAQIRAAEAQVAEAEVEKTRTEAEYARAQAIAESGALSREAIEARGAAAQAAAARLAAARAALAEVGARLQGGYVRAPAAGLVIERTATIGAYADQQSLFRIAGDNRLEVAAEVSEQDVPFLEKGMEASFRLGDTESVAAKLRRAPAAIDSQTRTGEALFDLPRDPRLVSGMFLRGEVVTAERKALAVPQTAVRYDTGAPTVFLIVEEKAQRAPVVLGPRNGDWVAVLEGLEQGQLVAGSGGAFLQDGDRVRPVLEEPRPAVAAGPPNRG